MSSWTPWAFALVLPIALTIDRFCGEPSPRWHPVVWMGNYFNRVAPHVLPAACAAPEIRDLKAFGRGALAWWLGVAIVLIVSIALQWLAVQLPLALTVLFMGLALKPLLAWAMLRREVQAIEDALAESLAAGRQRLSWLVSRDTAQLSEREVRESAIESLAENLNDSVVAPIFWFVLFGLPGAALYRFANTADAMWGYKGLRHGVNWEWAGKWAAWADDGLSWLPARITALLLALISWSFSLASLAREARKTPSPNSGWPMAAMALTLGISLSKPGVYTLNPAGRPPKAADTLLAQKYGSKVVLAHVLWAMFATILISLMQSV